MDEHQKIVDVMDQQQLMHNQFESHQQQQNLLLMQSHEIECIIAERQRQWQETIDPQNLVVGKVIGHGSEGVVYKGSYKGQTVAVKVLDDNGKKKISEDSMGIVKLGLMEEVEVWKNLDHPNVTKMIGATMSMITSGSRHKIKNPKPENNFCVVSEYLKGGSLRSYLLKLKHQDKKLPYKTVIRFAIDIAKGLSYLHSQKVIHRDVKPGNMLIDKKQTIKLADFGESEIEPPELLITCGERGTRGYMAPELVSKHPHGRKCDVYSFGICLWEIYCCDTAYTYDLGILTPDIYKYTRPSIPRHCPRSLAKLMEQCWDMDPTKRPEMKEVVVILEEIKKSLELLSRWRHPEGWFKLFKLRR
ncbi:unnamed protein product [Lactuca saligna]|uniref:Protein kinase domain-containing protein n=1 Tax=Lactuca saligna TaxID=75948 RepID=A0AA35ZZU3_LACSI|nr:unnamed protein product [Lactuca saligna]